MKFLKHKNKLLTVKTLNIFLFLVIVAIGIYYLTIINDLTVKGFQLMSLQKNVTRLINENKDINSKSTSLKSYNNLSQRAKDLNMVAVGDEVNYIIIMNEIAVNN
ncbi:hypothetical protein KKC56_02890 [Patescibacteria group bacterium]|nr:hypothetical protein [Patescibacteria group bacterium]